MTWMRLAVGLLVGAGVGFAMYKFVGCRTGACPLTANPWLAMAIWGLMGALLDRNSDWSPFAIWTEALALVWSPYDNPFYANPLAQVIDR